MSGSVQTSKSYQPKPPRLRAACNQCNAAKVRCSGERSGCSRCLSLRVDCIYVQSRVGKVQGARTKRKMAHTASTVSGDTTRSRSNSVHGQDDDLTEERDAVAVSIADLPSPKLHLLSSSAQPLQSWSPEEWSWDDSLLALDVPASLFNDMGQTMRNAQPGATGMGETEHSSSTSVSCESNQTSLDIDAIANLTTTAPSSPSVVQPTLPTPTSLVSASLSSTSPLAKFTKTAPPPPPPQLPQPACDASQPNPKMDSKCVLALANVVTTLENYLLSNLKVLDLILSTVRTTTDEVRKIMKYQQESRCDRCTWLFITIIYQIVTLLEAGSSALFEADASETQDNGGVLKGQDLMPQFGFGAFSTFNSEEQRSWKLHVIRKECQNVGEILAQLVTLAKMGPRDAPPPTPAQLEDRTKCFMGLQARLKVLSDSSSSAM